MSNDGDDQIELFYASKDNLLLTSFGLEPKWRSVPECTRCPDVDKAKSTVSLLKKHNDKFDPFRVLFKGVRIRDSVEVFNEFKEPLP